MSRLEELFSIQGRSALVTGGSGGIGAMIARAYVEAGARVYIASRQLEDCEQVAAELSSSGQCIALRADLSTEEGARGLAAEVSEREGSLDILVNNAARTWGAHLDDYPAIRMIENTGSDGLEPRPTGVRTGGSDGYQAINLAFHFGVKRIVLLGYDMKFGADGQVHWRLEERSTEKGKWIAFWTWNWVIAPSPCCLTGRAAAGRC